MYLHLGNQVIALQKSVLGVFDMDTAKANGRAQSRAPRRLATQLGAVSTPSDRATLATR